MESDEFPALPTESGSPVEDREAPGRRRIAAGEFSAARPELRGDFHRQTAMNSVLV